MSQPWDKYEPWSKEYIEARARACVRLKRPTGKIVEWPKPLSQMELCRRQAVIDATWERVIEERRRFDEDALEAERRIRDCVWGKR